MKRTHIGVTIAVLATGSVVTLAPAAAEPAYAQWPAQCRRDIGRICRDVESGEDKVILTCLQDNTGKLSAACRKMLQSYGHLPETIPGKRR